MGLIKIKAKTVNMDEALLALDVEPSSESDFAWLETYIRSEDVKDFYKKSDAKFVISYYDGRPDSIVKGPIEEFYRELDLIEYNNIYDEDLP